MDELLHHTQRKTQTLSAQEKDVMFSAILAGAAAKPVPVKVSPWKKVWLSLSVGSVALAGGLAAWLWYIQPTSTPRSNQTIATERFIQNDQGQYLPVHDTQLGLELGGGSAVSEVNFSTWKVDTSTMAKPTTPSPTTLPALQIIPLTDNQLTNLAKSFPVKASDLHFSDWNSGDGLIRTITNYPVDSGNSGACDSIDQAKDQPICFNLQADGTFTFNQQASVAPDNGIDQLMQLFTDTTGIAAADVIVRQFNGHRGMEVNIYPKHSQYPIVWDATLENGMVNFIAGTMPLTYQAAEDIQLITTNQAIERLQQDFKMPVQGSDFFFQDFQYSTILNPDDFAQYDLTHTPPAQPQLQIKAIQLEYVAEMPDDNARRTGYHTLLPSYRVIGQEINTGMPFEATINAAKAGSVWLNYSVF